MKFFTHIALLVFLITTSGLHTMHSALALAISDGSSDSDDKIATTRALRKATPSRVRARTVGSADLQGSTYPQRPSSVKKLSLSTLSDSARHEGPSLQRRLQHSPLAGSTRSWVSLPDKLKLNIINESNGSEPSSHSTSHRTSSQPSSQLSSYRTPRGTDEAELYFGPGHDPKTIFISLMESIRGRDIEAIVATNALTDPEIIDIFVTLPNERLLCVYHLDEATRNKLLKAGVAIYLLRQSLPYTLAMLGDIGIMGSYTPSCDKEIPKTHDRTMPPCLDNLTIFHTDHPINAIIAQLRYLVNQSSDEVSPINTTMQAAQAANPSSNQ